MKNMFAVVFAASAIAMAASFCGCEGDSGGSGYRTLEPEQTGVVPATGRYVMKASGIPSNGYQYQRVFTVTAPNNIDYSSDTFASYSITIYNGGVAYSNGNFFYIYNDEKVTLSDTHNAYPTDGFGIWAKWTSPTHCEGIFFWSSTENGVPFTADKG